VCSPGWQPALHAQSVELQTPVPMPTCCKLPVHIAQPGMLHQRHLHMHKGENCRSSNRCNPLSWRCAQHAARLTWNEHNCCVVMHGSGGRLLKCSPQKVEALQAAPCPAQPPGACRPQLPAAASPPYRRLQHDKLASQHDAQAAQKNKRYLFLQVLCESFTVGRSFCGRRHLTRAWQAHAVLRTAAKCAPMPSSPVAQPARAPVAARNAAFGAGGSAHEGSQLLDAAAAAAVPPVLSCDSSRACRHSAIKHGLCICS
jgi:hypothetical protein